MRKRIIDAWRVLTGEMKAVPTTANVFVSTGTPIYISNTATTSTGNYRIVP